MMIHREENSSINLDDYRRTLGFLFVASNGIQLTQFCTP